MADCFHRCRTLAINAPEYQGQGRAAPMNHPIPSLLCEDWHVRRGQMGAAPFIDLANGKRVPDQDAATGLVLLAAVFRPAGRIKVYEQLRTLVRACKIQLVEGGKSGVYGRLSFKHQPHKKPRAGNGHGHGQWLADYKAALARNMEKGNRKMVKQKKYKDAYQLRDKFKTPVLGMISQVLGCALPCSTPRAIPSGLRQAWLAGRPPTKTPAMK